MPPEPVQNNTATSGKLAPQAEHPDGVGMTWSYHPCHPRLQNLLEETMWITFSACRSPVRQAGDDHDQFSRLDWFSDVHVKACLKGAQTVFAPCESGQRYRGKCALSPRSLSNARTFFRTV